MRDGLSDERPTVLVLIKRRFRCATPSRVRTFAGCTAELPRRRATARLCVAMAGDVRDRSTAAAFNVAETNRLARTMRAWQPELLACFDRWFTNGPTEGTNRIIKAVKRQGFGYTNAQNYRWRVLYCCA